MPSVSVQAEPFDVGAEMAALAGSRTDIGAIASFTGLCRADDGLAGMTLEHWPGVTERAITAIVDQALARWPLTGCRVIHRYGPMRPGDGIVLVLAASAHRNAALQAVTFLMDWLKTKAPFWKREDFADGTHRWVEAKTEDDAAAARWTTG
jgi:molybdopterin synthase catalytic subunit